MRQFYQILTISYQILTAYAKYLANRKRAEGRWLAARRPGLPGNRPEARRRVAMSRDEPQPGGDSLKAGN